MAKDYFSDIDTQEPLERTPVAKPDDTESSAVLEKSIRNISISPRRNSLMQRMPVQNAKTPNGISASRRFLHSRALLWGGILFAFVTMVCIGYIVFYGGTTTITITPRVHHISFDPATQFTAYPQNDSNSNALVYSTQNFTIEESVTVPANGVEKAEERASGTITVFNAYSDKPTRLIKNTRFESPDGLIFRIPSSIEVPGKKGSTPGQIDVTVFADQAGAQYNIGPTEKFTVPGLKATRDMYNGIYARSTSAFTGGFIGEKPAIVPAALESARAELRAILQAKLPELLREVDGFTFDTLASIEFESAPTVSDPAGGAKVTEKARIAIPVFPSDQFAKAIAQAASADVADTKVSLRPRGQFTALVSGSPANVGSAPIVFGLAGNATIVWDVEAEAVKQALEGKEQSAFKPIIANFLGIKEAEAHPPFWTSTFPNADKLEITIVDPTQTQ